MNSRLPLLAHTAPATPLAYRQDGIITAEQFLADVRGLAAALPAGQHVLNVCSDRYRFTVGLAACLIAGKISLLPSTHTPETVRQLLAIAPDVFCLTDAANETIALPQFQFPPAHFPITDDFVVPHIDAAQTVAHVFTSGSTGLPMAHRKSWGKLVGNIAAAADRLCVAGQPIHLVGTVPAQHMYGFESTVLLPLLTGGAFWAGRPFYPADIAAALAALPQPRGLITTPVHLRTLIDAEIPLPQTDLLISATAPLSTELARRAETALGGELREIYGCTETGQLATRRPSRSSEWQLFADITLTQENRDGIVTIAAGPHIEGQIVLNDVLELTAGRQFILHGRHADLINIAGKRTSLTYLNHQLNAIPGVIDGAFFVPDDHAVDGVTRLSACVVAPSLDRVAVERALRERIDPIFLPRPLYLVEALPRNATGKLPQPALRDFLTQLKAKA